MLQQIKQGLTRFISERNTGFADNDEESRFRNYTIFCIFGSPIMIAFGIYNLLRANYLLALALFISLTGFLAGLILLHRNIASQAVYRINSLVFCLLLLYVVTLGGPGGSKSLWCYVFPLVTFFLLGSREGAIWTILLFLALQFIFWNPYHLASIHGYPLEFSLRFDIVFLCVSVFTYFYEQFRVTYRYRIEDQNRRLNNEIVERKKAEEALRMSEEKYKAIYLQAAEGITVIDPQGRVLECNPQMTHMLGFANNDLVGINIHDLIHPDDLRQTPTQMPKVLSGETVMLERRMRTANGDYRLFERSGRLVDQNRILLLYRDITDRKAAEIALAKANRELDRLANIDGLTQIANRRKFETALRAEWQRLSREKLPLSMIIGDIDYFKQFNDLYGHQEGDNCLITIAQTLEHSLHRPADLVARLGGEEFILLLPNTHLAGCLQIAEGIRRRVSLLRIPHKGSACSPYVTMSLGVSSIVPNHKQLPDDLIAVADKALYMAKQNGRNRVETASPELLE